MDFVSNAAVQIPVAVMKRVLDAAEAGAIPDALLRWGIRRLCADRAKREAQYGLTSSEFAEQMGSASVATHTELANAQHYEVPTELFQRVLGPYMKYSACVFENDDTTLEEAEVATLELTLERAGIEDGMRVLDLGCGWGSFTTFLAERFPRCEITAVSNSATQREWITKRCAQPGWAPVEVITADAATFDPGEARFDRVVSVEMFEHMRNWGPLFDRIARALTPDGAFFMHVFCHRDRPYLFEDEGEPDWMARNFFSGGIMPSFELPRHVKSGLEVEADWRIDGRHYARTLRCWLDRLDAEHREVEACLASVSSEGPTSAHDVAAARKAVQRWRMFFMACEELFAFDFGREWFVGHYRLRPHGGSGRASQGSAS